MIYLFICDECGKRKEVSRPVEARNLPVFCYHIQDEQAHLVLMRRKLTVPIVNADLEKDRPENQLFRILSKSNSRGEWKEYERYYAEGREKEAEADSEPAKTTTVDDILATGIRPDWTKEAVMQWREDHIPKDDFVTGDGKGDQTNGDQ